MTASLTFIRRDTAGARSPAMLILLAMSAFSFLAVIARVGSRALAMLFRVALGAGRRLLVLVLLFVFLAIVFRLATFFEHLYLLLYLF